MLADSLLASRTSGLVTLNLDSTAVSQEMAGRAFVPTLRNLQCREKLEGQVPDQVWKNYAENLWIDLGPFEKFLLARETESPSLPADVKHWIVQIKREAPLDIEEDFQKHKLLATIWLHELSIRRCV